MKYLVLCLLLSGCATTHGAYTIFLKGDTGQFYDLKGNDCIVSGYSVMQNPNDGIYRLTTFFKNCDIHVVRQLEEKELKNWIPNASMEIR